MDSLLHDENTELVVAEKQRRVIACGYAKIVKAKEYVNYVFYSYLDFIYVALEFRDQGINQVIIDALAGWSLDQGISRMHLDVYADNQAAVSAYKKVGFVPCLLEMRLNLTSES